MNSGSRHTNIISPHEVRCRTSQQIGSPLLRMQSFSSSPQRGSAVFPRWPSSLLYSMFMMIFFSMIIVPFMFINQLDRDLIQAENINNYITTAISMAAGSATTAEQNRFLLEQRKSVKRRMLSASSHYYIQNTRVTSTVQSMTHPAAPLLPSIITVTERRVVPENSDWNRHYTSLDEVNDRTHRFPSVQERVKLYMSTWYLPPCSEDEMVQYVYEVPNHPNTTSIILQPTIQDKNQHTLIAVDTTISHDRNIFLYQPDRMEQCKDKFCYDFVKYIVPSLRRVHDDTTMENGTYPIVLQFGDSEKFRAVSTTPDHNKNDVHQNYPSIPVIKKFRYAMTQTDLERVTTGECYSATNDQLHQQQQQQHLHAPRTSQRIASTVRDPVAHSQAIISIVSNYERHFGPLHSVSAVDIPWEKKYNMAVYRGALTGTNKVAVVGAAAAAAQKRMWSDDYATCQQIPRCRFVYQSDNSSYVNAKLVPLKGKSHKIPQRVNGVTLFGAPMSMEEMLQYKAIVMLEGNDVSSGLKWALYSNSVVLTQPPTCTSWAMEELLQPWVHYVPIADDFHDVEEQVQWVIDHAVEAQQIARNGHLWMSDLVFHPHAMDDNEQVMDETMRRYRAHFRSNPKLLQLVPTTFVRTETLATPTVGRKKK